MSFSHPWGSAFIWFFDYSLSCLKCTFFFTPGDKRTDNELTGTMVIQVTNRSTAIQLPDKEICFNSSSQGQL